MPAAFERFNPNRTLSVCLTGVSEKVTTRPDVPEQDDTWETRKRHPSPVETFSGCFSKLAALLLIGMVHSTM